MGPDGRARDGTFQDVGSPGRASHLLPQPTLSGLCRGAREADNRWRENVKASPEQFTLARPWNVLAV